jgi:hypothetical protein
MNMDDYPNYSLDEEGCLHFTGQKRPEFPRVLYDALIHLGYEVREEIPFDPWHRG